MGTERSEIQRDERCRAEMTFTLVKKAREKRNFHAAEEKPAEAQ
jgi:hypothetical protein